MFGLLTGGSRTALPRQQTLRALIDWSYDLLSEAERVLLRRLSVFAGGWSLEAAEVICGGEGSDQGEVLDLLRQLVDKSLVQYEARHGEGRYRLLETVRQYARDRLLEAEEAAAVRERHRDWCLALAEEAEPGLLGESQTAWLDRLEREHDNLLAALEWCQEGEAERALRLTAAMGRFWHDRGYWNEGCQWLERALARAPSAAPTVERARMLTAAGRMASLQGDQPTARARLEESVALYRVLGDVRGLIWALDGLANVMRHLKGMGSAEARALMEEAVALGRSLGDPHILARALDELAFTLGQGGEFQAARVLWQESLALARRAGDEEAMAWSLLHLGEAVERQGDWEAALDLMEQAWSLARAAKHVEAIGWTLSCLGTLLYRHGNVERAKSLLEETVALGRAVGEGVWISKTLSVLADLVMDHGHRLLERGDYAAARSRYEEGLAWRRAAGDASGAACALVEVGHAAWLQGEPGVTRSHALEALALFQGFGNKEGILAALESLAVAALAQGWKARTGRLMGAVGALREALGLSGPDWWRCPRERMGEAVRAASLDQAFAAAWAEGRAMSLAQAIQFAREEAAGD
jgi:tetratricopeptide (TPR) repeat protein